jgi:RNA polymerase sigma factor (sigma-70 family)
MSGVVKHLRRGALLGDPTALSDGQLLECYITSRDEAAFAALVRRHGPMVWGVCRRVLAGHHDAEDAFQATFLVLARKAAAVATRELVGNWLYGVATNVALKARAVRLRRRARERQVNPMPQPTVADRDLWTDLGPVLDQELSRLPDKYRVPVVLCDLQGKSYKEAAELLGCPDGTLATRLARARGLLAQRLSRRGVVLSSGALALALSQDLASASVPAAVVSNTIKAATAGSLISAHAAALCEGAIKTMLLSKLRYPLGILLACAVLVLGAGILHSALASPDSQSGGAAAATAMIRTHAAQAAKKTDAERFVGTWRFKSGTFEGKDFPEELKVLARMTFTKDGKLVLAALTQTEEGAYKLVGDGKVDLALRKSNDLGLAIYKFAGDDELTICASRDGDTERPTEFSGAAGSGQNLIVLQRAKPGEEKPTAEEVAKYGGSLDKMRGDVARELLGNRLRQIAVAFHDFFDKTGELPLHAIYAKDDTTPLLSWRVAILPNLGYQDLYNEFKHDEPWDSPHNKKLIAKMPDIYAPVSVPGKPAKVEPGRTHLQVFTGTDTVFDGTRRMKLVDITDGLSNTILVIEAKEPVTWTKPDDLPLPGKKGKMPALGGQIHDTVGVVFFDGGVRIFPAAISQEVIRALATPRGGETVDFEKLKVVE